MPEWKTASVFISSTFNDMHSERDYLIKYVFPELAEKLEKRKIRLVDIDLRWGVTAEESRNNHALLKCLENIDECRPFFLCLIGQRRGWVPNDPLRLKHFNINANEISPETLLEYPEVIDKQNDSEHSRRRSVTEMEIEHALLSPLYRYVRENKPEPCNALFFERINPFVGLTESEFTEYHKKIYTNQDVTDWGGSPENADRAIEDLKDNIGRKNIIPYTCEWNSNIKTPELSGEKNGGIISHGRLLFTDDFKNKIIDRLENLILGTKGFDDRQDPVAVSANRYDSDLAQQDQFVNSVADDLVGRDDIIDKLNQYVNSDSKQIFLLTAKAGYGKTTLLANFIRQIKTKKVLYRFCGVSDLTADAYSLWDSLCRQLQLQSDLEIPAEPDDLSREMPKILEQFAKRGVSVLVIDAIDQMRKGLEMLECFNKILPDGLKLIISVKENDKNSDALDGYGKKETFHRENLTPLSDENIQFSLMDRFLLHYLKSLDVRQKTELCAKNSSGNPLFLKIVLHELRRFGSFTQLPKEIESYGADPAQAFTKMLERLENDSAYEIMNPKSAVPFLFGLLSHARNGLTENEIIRCFLSEFTEFTENADNEKSRKLILGTIRFFCRQARPFMARRNGRIDFLYDSFKEASYLRYKDSHKKIHKSLRDCFLKISDPSGDMSFNSDDSDYVRALTELGYHTAQFDYREGLRLYENLAYLHERCSKSSVQVLLSEIKQFDSEICGSFYNIILRHQSLLSNYPNVLFSVCRTEKSSPVYSLTEELISAKRRVDPWIDTGQIYFIQDGETDSEKSLSSLSLKLISQSDDYVFNTGCGFSVDGSVFIFSETLGRLRVFDTNTFELLPCIIQTRPVRVTSIRISPDRMFLAVAHEDAAIELFKLNYNQDSQLFQTVHIGDITTYKPKRGFSSFGFAHDFLCYQSDAQTIMAQTLKSPGIFEILRSEQPFILDAVISLKDDIILAVRQGMRSVIFGYSYENKNAGKIKELDEVFIKYACKISKDFYAVALSDNRAMILDADGNTAAEKKMENDVKSICAAENKLLILCRNDELVLWDWIKNQSSEIYAKINQEHYLNELAYTDNDNKEIMSVLGGSVAKFEIKAGHTEAARSGKQIVAFDELPELTVAVKDNDSITVQKNDFCSLPLSIDERFRYEINLTPEMAYLFDDLGHSWFLAQNQTYFQPLIYTGQPLRILKSCAAADGRVYYIDTLWNFRCLQGDFEYDLSRYHIDIVNLRAFKKYIVIFGTASGVQATQSAATGHEPLTGTLLIFEITRPGFLKFCGERLFSAGYGNLMDIAYHEKTNQLYIIFNTPHSDKKMDLLHVCYGKAEDLILGKGYHKDLNIARKQKAPSTACAADSYLVCYQGNIFAYDAITLEYQSAVAAGRSFDRLQPSRNSPEYALALCGNSTQIKTITPIFQKPEVL